jgi:peptidyl-prolyl cis-trans isomerase SurA
MTVRFAGLPALALAGALLLSACGGTRPATSPGDPVARWDGGALTLSEFEDAYAATESAVADTAMTVPERRVDFLERYVDFQLKVLAARAAGYDRDSAYLAEVAEYRDQLAGPYFTDRQILDDIVRDIYEKQAEQISVRHLLIRVGPYAPAPDTLAAYTRAAAIRDSIQAGAYTFEAAARRYSQDPSVAQNGGALGYFTGGMTVLEFEDAAYSTPVGQTAGPVRTQFGYHLLEVMGRRPAPGEVQARHILLRPAGGTAADTAAAVARIDSLRARVLAGEDFGALARQYSQDPGSAPQGGDLGTFGAGRMVPQFEEAAFALQNPGDVSPAVRTQFGVHLVQLTRRIPRPTFEAAYDDLRQQALRLPRTAIKRRAIGREFREANGGRFDAGVVRAALAQFPADSAYVRVTRDGFGPAFSGQTFAVIGDTVLTVSRLQDVYRRTRVGEDPVETLVQVAEDYVDERSVEQAVAALESRDPEFARVFRSYSDGVLYFRVAEDSVWTPAKDDEAGLRAYYAARPGQYRWPDRRRALAFRTPGDSILQVVADELTAGRTPAEVFATHGGGRFNLRLDTVYVADSTQTALDRVLGMNPGENSGVVAERSRLAVYFYEGIEPAREKTFEEARAELISGYQEDLETAWEERLRDRYDAETYPDRVPPVGPPRPATTGTARVGG